MKTEFIVVTVTDLDGDILDKVVIEIPQGRARATAECFTKHLADNTAIALSEFLAEEIVN